MPGTRIWRGQPWRSAASEGGFGSDTVAGGLWPGGYGHDTVNEAMISDLNQDRDQILPTHLGSEVVGSGLQLDCALMKSHQERSAGWQHALRGDRPRSPGKSALPGRFSSADGSKYAGPRRSRCRALRKPLTASVPGAAALVRSTVPHLCTLASHVKTNTLRPRSSQVRKAPYRELATKVPRGWPAEQWQSIVSWRNLETQ